MARVDQILCHNSFELTDFTRVHKRSIGLWNFPSSFNHSCIPNAQYIFIGDVIFVYAYKNIEKDEEIFIQYFALDSKDVSKKKECNSKFVNDTINSNFKITYLRVWIRMHL